MPDSAKIGNFIMERRKQLHLTQQHLADRLHVSFGYLSVRLLMDKMPQIKLDQIDGLTFIEQVMKPHTLPSE